jgi:hypothetical protein
MVLYPVYPVKVTAAAFADAPYILEESLPTRFDKGRSPVLGTEDDLVENLYVGRHDKVSR